MIPWRKIQRESFTTLQEIASFLELDEENRAKLLDRKEFPLLLPRRLASKIAKNDLKDPLARQFLPVQEEKIVFPNFVRDPVEDAHFRKTPRLLQKYQGRALVLTTSVCAMNCRFCFRQNFAYDVEKTDFQEEIAYLKEDPSLREVILSGGDPLSLSDESLKKLFDELETIEHLSLIRFHTRFPIGIPERITDELLALFASCKKQIIFVLHVNHVQELDADHFTAFKKIGSVGVPILSQSVLLKGVNDNLDALRSLFLTLISQGIIPYYLHQLDPVQGSHTFHVSKEEGLTLLEELQKELPGYAIPTFVEETPHHFSKQTISRVL